MRSGVTAFCLAVAPVLRAALSADQYAVCVDASIEKLAAAYTATVKSYPRCVALQLDANCAFNSILRETVMEEIALSFPSLPPFHLFPTSLFPVPHGRDLRGLFGELGRID